MSEPLAKFVETVRLCGGILTAFCILGVIIVLATEETDRYRQNSVELFVVMMLGHGIPAALFFGLAAIMTTARPWAFVAAIVLTMLCVIKAFAGMAMICAGGRTSLAYGMAVPFCAPVQLIFLGYVAARCALAWPEIRHLQKTQARSRALASGKIPPIAPPQFPAIPRTPPRPPRRRTPTDRTQ